MSSLSRSGLSSSKTRWGDDEIYRQAASEGQVEEKAHLLIRTAIGEVASFSFVIFQFGNNYSMESFNALFEIALELKSSINSLPLDLRNLFGCVKS